MFADKISIPRANDKFFSLDLLDTLNSIAHEILGKIRGKYKYISSENTVFC